MGIALNEALKGSTGNYEWKARETQDANVYLVSLVDRETGRGYFWATNIKTGKVVYVNPNRYLCQKYGLIEKDTSGKFVLTKLEKNDFVSKITRGERKVLKYHLVGYIKNNTGQPVTSASLKCVLNIVFKEKTITEPSKSFFGLGFNTRFKDEVSRKKPWKPGEIKKFEFVTEVDPIYFTTYKPEFVVTDVILRASNPVGLDYEGTIEEVPVKMPKI